MAAVDGLGGVDQLGEGEAEHGENFLDRPVVADRADLHAVLRFHLGIPFVWLHGLRTRKL
jgi:hypothetical protein